jgi:hypothetical protein
VLTISDTFSHSVNIAVGVTLVNVPIE